MKKLVAIFLAVCLLASVASSAVSAWADNENTGSFGSGFSFYYSRSTGTLLIKGTGRLLDLNVLGGTTPWDAFRDGIFRLIFSEGITYIPAGLFNNLTNLTSVVLPHSIEEIDSDAFLGCEGISRLEVTGSEEEAKALGEKLKADGVVGLSKVNEIIAVTAESIALEEAAVIEEAEKEKNAAGWEPPPKSQGPELISEETEYDDQGRLIRLKQVYDDGSTVVTEYDYDEDGEVSFKSVTQSFPDGTETVVTDDTRYGFISHEETRYNADGLPVYEKAHYEFPDGSFTANDETTYTYDDDGNLISTVNNYDQYMEGMTDEKGRPNPAQTGTETIIYDPATGNRTHVLNEYESTLFRGVAVFEYDDDENIVSSIYTEYDKETGDQRDSYSEFYKNGQFSLDVTEETDAATGNRTVTTRTYDEDGTYVETVVVYDKDGNVISDNTGTGSPVARDPGLYYEF